jgi:hypothetical protein
MVRRELVYLIVNFTGSLDSPLEQTGFEPSVPPALCKFFAAGAGGTPGEPETRRPFSRDRRALVKLKRLSMVTKVPLVFGENGQAAAP